MNIPSTYQYEIGGSLSTNAPTYVVRQADEELYETLIAGKFCYVLNSRQMGKSSLRVRTMQRLKEAGIACADVDLTGIGSQGLTEEQWYGGVVNELIQGLQLPESFDWRSWWREKAPLAHVQRWGRFIEEVLLTHISGNIVIFIDEIDSVLSLQFPFDDFFAQIRFCHNKRADDPAYQRLTFCLLGVATPSDLIQDRRRTPFNIGRAIELTGFQVHEAAPLAQGLVTKTSNPEVVLQAILEWTGGQPFLTQKVCQLVLDDQSLIPEGQEASWIQQFVQTRIIENWETQDEPEHLRTIRNRIFRSEQNASSVLQLYQNILEQNQIPADNSPEQAELRLSGLVVKQQGMLEAYNPIYRAVFNQQWVEEAIAKLQPQDEAIAERLSAIRDTILQHKSCTQLLELYQRILQQQSIAIEDTPETKLLLNLGLIKEDAGQLKVASRVYVNFFNQDWVEQELTKSRQRRIIRQRYDVIEKLDSGSSIQTYRVKDLQHPSKLQCILKQITPPNVGAFARMHNLFTNAYMDLQQLNTHAERQIANLIACFDEDEKFYLVQEFVAGHNLDIELDAERQWSETQVIDLLIEISEILAFVHALKLSHLNLQPSNIRRRDQDGKLVLIDFGILKQICNSVSASASELPVPVVGSPGYVPYAHAETFSETSLDIYATGMIGIQALTGMEPSHLAIDPTSGEVIWRFSTFNRPGRDVSPELTRILDKMIDQRADERYSDMAQVLDDLRHFRHQITCPEPPKSRLQLLDKRFLVGATLSLIATSLGGFWWYQQALATQKDELLMQHCNQPLQSRKDGNRPLDTDMIADAQKVEAACNQLLEQAQLAATTKIDVLKRRGEALLLLGKSSQDLDQAEDATRYLEQAQKSFQEAVTADPNNPQVRFYLGLAKQLQNHSGFEEFKAAIALYLGREMDQIERSNYPILAKLAAYLPQDPTRAKFHANNFDQADQLYKQAIALNPDTRYQVNLAYNHGVLNHRTNHIPAAARILGTASDLDPNNQFPKQYLETCFVNNPASQSRCPLPFVATAASGNRQQGRGKSQQPVAREQRRTVAVAAPPLKDMLPIYSCKDYPVLAIARLGSRNADNLCQ
ncbi:MAG: AAA-like domain-containing protein [Leptolyngbyaceae cyanobacterium bins.349]|nr:AAA-like domain-containing protein [Leptolyngbyaceae cyanobacterium bins.349]